jgi:hypothetical protein
VTYPDPAVAALIATHFVPLRLSLNRAADRADFRAYQVIWTPTTAVLDRRGTLHYQAPGFHSPALFVALLRIGLARALIAWARYSEAAEQLELVGGDATSPFAAEALYWLGIARYLPRRSDDALYAVWRRLATEHPHSIWAARIPPGALPAE